MPNTLANSLPVLPVAPVASVASDSPRVRLGQLDNLWFQITGTLCNLTCTHCFISCSPGNHSFGFLDYDQILRILRESRPLGVKEYYFTGGEPFMHPRMLDILEQTLAIGPATVLTNGTLFSERTIERLATLRDGSIYSLELRISIDGPDAASNDRIRGLGSFDRAMTGVKRLVEAGFLPIVTMAQTWDDFDAPNVYEQMRQALLAIGYYRPRIKLLPSIRLGAEVLRHGGYREDERVTPQMMQDYDPSQLICSNSRIVTDRGMHVCPILIEEPDSVLADSLEESTKKDYALRHRACHTCWMYGAICTNASAMAELREVGR